MRILEEADIATTPKHFPGDGVDERDQHLVTSVNSLSCKEWDETFGKVYSSCIDAGARALMIGHIMQPAYVKHFNPQIKDEDILLATLSKEIMVDLLRGKLGFNGLILTDATTMVGMSSAMRRKDDVPASIAAGADVFLFCRNTEEDYNYMLQGYRDGVITEDRLNEAILRILGTKAAINLHIKNNIPDYEYAKKIVGCSEHKEIEKECAAKAVTLVKNKQDIFPLNPQDTKRLLLHPILMSGDSFFTKTTFDFTSYIKESFEKEGFEVTVFEAGKGMEGMVEPYSKTENAFDLIVYAANLATKSNQTTVRIEWAQPMGANCPVFSHTIPTIFISFANPYHLLDVPQMKTYINAYKFKPSMVEAVMDCLMGRKEFAGIDPVDSYCGKWDTRL